MERVYMVSTNGYTSDCVTTTYKGYEYIKYWLTQIMRNLSSLLKSGKFTFPINRYWESGRQQSDQINSSQLVLSNKNILQEAEYSIPSFSLENLTNSNFSQTVNSKKYFKYMRDVTKQISPLMLNVVKSIDSSECPPELVDIISGLVKKRATPEITKLRPFMVVLASGVTQIDSASPELLQVAALVELLNIASYLDNLAFDDKGSCKSGDKISFGLAANILDAAIHENLSAIEDIDPRLLNQIHTVFSESSRNVAQGQYIDLEKMPVLGSERGSLMSIDDYVKLYIQRCRFIGGGSLGFTCVAGGIIGNVNSEQLIKLRKFGYYHGLALQVINDVADFVPITKAATSVGKDDKDRYADMRNHRLTLPLYIAYTLSTPADREYLCSWKSDIPMADDEYLFDILGSTKAFDYSYSLAKLADQKALNAIKDIVGTSFDFIKASLNVSLDNGKYKYIREKMGIPVQEVSESTHDLGKSFLDIIENELTSLPN
jgi:heptaprenyl diphosphate synthase